MDNEKLSAITRNLDPLALVFIFLYFLARDLWGFHLSEETLLYFAGAAATMRVAISRTFAKLHAEHLERQRKEEQAERRVEQAELRALIVQQQAALKRSVETCLALSNDSSSQTNNGTADCDDSQVSDIRSSSDDS